MLKQNQIRFLLIILRLYIYEVSKFLLQLSKNFKIILQNQQYLTLRIEHCENYILILLKILELYPTTTLSTCVVNLLRDHYINDKAFDNIFTFNSYFKPLIIAHIQSHSFLYSHILVLIKLI